VTTLTVVSFLRAVTLFTDLGEAHLVSLAPRLRERKLRKGEVLFREGDPGQEMFLIRSGTVIISKAVTGRVEQVLARLGPGEFFGEMSLLDQAPRSATVQADGEAVLFCLDRGSLQQFVEVSPRAAAAFFSSLARTFARRLRASGDLVAEVTRWGLEATGLDVESR
jgi:CRP/FNR family transcriptional regulator, cyclic AMP receptor protein